MKYPFCLFAMFFVMVWAVQPIQAEEHPDTMGEVEEAETGAFEDVEEEGSVLEEGEEGEITERGLRRFKLKPRKRILVPKKPAAGTKKFRLKRRPLVPPGGSSNSPPGENETPSVEPPDPIEPPGPIETPDSVESPSQCVWHTSDIIDPRIDVSAQERLMAMMSRGGEERLDASAMIGAVKQGVLAGILLAPRKVVSDRGQRMTPPKGWWELIPQGQLGTCLQEPGGEPPIILYRDKNGASNLDPSLIARTLRNMWGQCGLPTPDPACSYLVDLHKPPLAPGSTDEQPEGSGELQVLVMGNGKPVSGVQVTVIANRKEPLGHQNFQNEPGPGTTIMRTAVTNSEGVANFFLPALGKGIQVHAKGPPGFSNASIVVGGLILDRRLMMELQRIEDFSS